MDEKDWPLHLRTTLLMGNTPSAYSRNVLDDAKQDFWSLREVLLDSLMGLSVDERAEHFFYMQDRRQSKTWPEQGHLADFQVKMHFEWL